MSTLERLATALQSVVEPEALLTDSATEAYAIDAVIPAFVVLPATEDQVGEVLRLTAEHGVTVFPRGGGSHMALGQTPARVDVVLSVERLQQQVAYEPGDMTATVQAGVCLADLQQTLGQHGQFLALDPPATAATTVGGVIAANLSGPRRFLYGTARDLVLGTAVIDAEGIRTKAGGRVVKNVTGYDLNKLYIGSMGTLAVLVELTFKVHPLPSGEVTIGIDCTHDADTLPLLQLLLQLPLRLNSVELLNAAALQALGQRTGVALPETAYMFLARVEGHPEVTASQTQRLMDALPGVQLQTPSAVYTWKTDEQARLWDGIGEILQHAPGVLTKVSLRLADLPMFCDGVQEMSGATPWPLCVHAGSGIAYVNMPPDDSDKLIEQSQQLDTWVARLHGHRVIERAPLAVKQQCQVWGVPGDALSLMQALKTAFDPQHRLNPGRFIGGL